MIQLTEYLEDNKLIHSKQYGFRKFHSTEYAALQASWLPKLRNGLKTHTSYYPFWIYQKLSIVYHILYYYINSDFMG